MGDGPIWRHRKPIKILLRGAKSRLWTAEANKVAIREVLPRVACIILHICLPSRLGLSGLLNGGQFSYEVASVEPSVAGSLRYVAAASSHRIFDWCFLISICLIYPARRIVQSGAID